MARLRAERGARCRRAHRDGARRAGSALLAATTRQRRIRAGDRRAERSRALWQSGGPADRGREVLRFRIVGEDEADPAPGLLSWVAPLVEQLLGARMGDAASFQGRVADLLLIDDQSAG